MKQIEILTIEEILNLGFQNYKKNNFLIAKNLYNEVLKKDPEHVQAQFYLGKLYEISGKLKKSISYFEKVIEIDPNYINAYINLGSVFNLLKKYEKAKNCYEKAIEIDPNSSIAYNNLGVLFYNDGEIKKAKNCYEKAIEINPNDVGAYTNLGKLFGEIKDFKNELSCYEKAFKIDPNFQGLRYNLGVSLYEKKKYKEASEHFKLTDFDLSKDYLLDCLYKLENKSIFFKELDERIKQGEVNSVIGSIVALSKIKFGIDRPNPFCNDPLNYVFNKNLIKHYDFNNIFINTVKNIFDNNMVLTRNQELLTNGIETAGNLFDLKVDYMSDIKNIIDSEINEYQTYFKNSNEGLIKNWPNSYFVRGWLVKMKSGGNLSPHMHQYGWLSGCIYVNVPPKVNINSGNLVVCVNDDLTKVNNKPNLKKIINVDTGSLCLFPASLYHSTIPFESEEERIVLAFDVIAN